MNVTCQECQNQDDFVVYFTLTADLKSLLNGDDPLLSGQLSEMYAFTCKECGNYEKVECGMGMQERIEQKLNGWLVRATAGLDNLPDELAQGVRKVFTNRGVIVH